MGFGLLHDSKKDGVEIRMAEAPPDPMEEKLNHEIDWARDRYDLLMVRSEKTEYVKESDPDGMRYMVKNVFACHGREGKAGMARLVLLPFEISWEGKSNQKQIRTVYRDMFIDAAAFIREFHEYKASPTEIREWRATFAEAVKEDLEAIEIHKTEHAQHVRIETLKRAKELAPYILPPIPAAAAVQ